MLDTRPSPSVSRRTALAALGVASTGLALSATAHAAQEATPGSTVVHPIVGTWVVDRVPGDDSESPTIIILTADGAFIDPIGGTGGSWQATGPQSVTWTAVGMFDGGAGGYLLIRSEITVDAAGMTYDGNSDISVVAPDGTVQTTFQGTPHGMRMPIEPLTASGSPLAGFPTWTPPPPPAEATPAS